MNKRLVFRFDIDTHKCIRDGVPRLLILAKEMDVPFTFFLNCGKSIDLIDSLKTMIFRKSTDTDESPKMMSALAKLGGFDYLEAAIVNPNLYKYKNNIKMISVSNCELGLHGGHNHALWGKYGEEWDTSRIENEIDWALERLENIIPEYDINGFASPEWTSPKELPKILKNKGFLYYADLRCKDQEPIDKEGILPLIGVNMLGEPSGVAYFENRRVCGYNDQQIIDEIKMTFERLDTVVIYDHPYYAGINEISIITEIIKLANELNIKICKLEDLL